MKNLIKPGLIIALIFFSFPSQAITTTVTIPVEATNEMQAIRMTNRLEEIKAMDKSTLTATQKRTLRNEAKEIKRTQNSGGGVFLSVGAIIIIILLLIILL
jgi:hypothetical protein